ncbi:hypothetical protein, partial [Burkholderia vietnamiensis]|uniref:hypothetical protein n=1 Tax=Burkholderia vietnamiensis TaxID=60552 RepID=UPI001CF191AC
YAHRDHLCIPCSKIEQGIQSRGSKFDENYSLRWVSSAWTSTIPVMPEWLLEAGVRVTPTLRRLLEWAAGLEWLPMEERDFQVIEGEPHLEPSFSYPGLIPLRNGLSYLEDAVGGLRESADA